MCGIAGIYGAYDEQIIDKMINAQAHRGPDGRGVWSDPQIPATLGHCRLSIIDTSPAGHQPMSYAEGRFWITYNGEFYNYKEIRTELKSLGKEFYSQSDTEVILAAYAQWGVNCIRRFRGMFAFALIDKHPPAGSPELLLVRDRLGIKPLLYFENQTEILFASELRAILASGRVDRKVDPEALLDFLAVGAVSQPRTIIANVKTLPAGHWLEIRGKERKLVKYWDLHEDTKVLRKELKDISFEDATLKVRPLLLDAARYNMVADVPVGAFLSGGIDSTAVVGLMSEASGRKIQTYSVGFEDDHRAIDERHYARIAAKHLNCNLEEIVVTKKDAYNLFSQLIKDIDQPSIDGTNTWIVSRSASQSVKVAVSGLGGDELFAGYPHFYRFAMDKEFSLSHFPIAKKILERIHKIRPNRITLRLLFKYANTSERMAMLRRVLENFEFNAAVHKKWSKSFREHLIGRQRNLLRPDADKVQQTSYSEINDYLLNTLLRDGDVMSMSHGLEVRPLLLDHPLVEFSYALPWACKLNETQTKRVFTSAVEEYLPIELRTRPKMGFELPFIGWMAGDLRPRFEALLNGETARKIFQTSYLKKMKRSLRLGNPPRALWAWGILLSWLEEHQINLD